MKLQALKKYWWVIVLLIILLFSYSIRAVNIVPDRMLSFDPIFQYRFTKYLADWGHLPVWDELSYYTGRGNTPTNSPFLWYVTVVLYWILSNFGLSLLTTASYASAIYGAMMVIPAFFLGRELSNKYGGLVAALLIGTAPQILIRTFGSSYDTDQLVLFFILLTTYLSFKFVKKRNLTYFSLALIGLTAFMLTWGEFAFTSFIIIGFIILNIIVAIVFGLIRKNVNISKTLVDSLKSFAAIICLLIAILLVGLLFNYNPIQSFFNVIGFAQRSETWIVNISIAELQPFDILNLNGFITAMGRFITGIYFIDVLLLIVFVFAIAFGLFMSYKKDLGIFSFTLTLFLIGLFTTTRGIRFTEFSSSFFIVLISAGLGYLVEFFMNKNNMLKAFSIGLVLCIAFISMNLGQTIGKELGPDINDNWDTAWEFLRTKTPELSIVGTWWDPGHMIAGVAERRNFADGAHCANDCKYTINDRIADLGLIMATTDENVSLNLIRKYQGDSPKVYWIASDDLIGKYQWLQYFGTGCDARESNSNCPMYMQMPENPQMRLVDNNGNLAFRTYPLGQGVSIMVYNGQVPIPIYVQGINAVLFDEVIFYNGTQPVAVKFNETERDSIITALKPLERSLNVRFANQTVPMTVWVPSHYSYIVAIPPSLRNTVFTRMFMLEGQGLDHFKQVFRNEQVKIYEVI